MKPRFVLAFLCVFALLATLLLFATPVRAAPASVNFIVNNTGDAGDWNTSDPNCETIPTSNICTLRAAIEQANALAGSDTITFSVTGTIVLGSMLPPITDTLAIDGPGEANLTISGNNAVGVMRVNSGIAASLSRVTIANGNATEGAGIQISGTLTISSTTFRANAAGTGGAIYNDGGTTTLVNSTLYSNTASSTGGVIKNVNSAVMTVTNTTFYSNTGGFAAVVWNDSSSIVTISNSNVYRNASSTGGGMIYNTSKANITNSSFYSNTGNVNAGVIYNDVSGIATISSSVFYTNTGGSGGAFTNAGTLAITNSTFYDNRGISNSGVGFNTGSGVMTMTNSTLYGNHAPTAAGIWNNGSAFLRNTIVAFNSPGTNCFVSVVTSLGYNLESGNDCSFAGTGDLVNTNPLLGSLANNGGPTKTMALLPGSLAMNRIPNGTNGCGSYITTDQRGIARPQGNKCDIGAYEYDGAIYTLYLPLIMK